MASDNKPRKIMRVELTLDSHAKLPKLAAARGMTQVSFFSRALDWLAQQDESLVAMIVGATPGKDTRQIAREALKALAK